MLFANIDDKLIEHAVKESYCGEPGKRDLEYENILKLTIKAKGYSLRGKAFTFWSLIASPIWVGITTILFSFGRITADEAVISNCCAAAYLLITSLLAIRYNKLSAKCYDELISIVEDKISRIEKQEQIHKI